MASTDSLLKRELKGAREREADYRRRLSRHRELALKLRLHGSALRESLREHLDPGETASLLGEALRLSSEALGVSRAGVWLFDEGRQELVCRLQLPNGEGSGQARISVADCPRYLAAVRASELGALAVDDVTKDPRTSELTDYLKQHGVGALLDIPIQGPGQLRGVVCHEHQGGPRVWREEEIEFGTQVGVVLALALEGERSSLAERTARNAEAKYQDLVESLPVTVYSYEVGNGRVVYLSPRIRELSGRAAEHYLSAGGIERWLEAIEPDHREAVERRLAARDLEPLDGELVYPIRLPDGTRRWIRDQRAIVRDARGQALALRGTLSDVTALKDAEMARAEMEARHRTLLENIDLLAVSLDGTGRVEFVNDCFVRVTGYSRTDALGADAFTLLLPDKHREQVRSTFLEGMRQGQLAPRFETTVRTRGGRTCQILWTNTLRRSLAGAVKGSSSLGVDITHRLQAEASSLEHQKLESLGRLAASVAHDFNNMLSVIAAAAAEIEGGSGGPLAEARHQIDLAVDQATGLTRSLLAYARHETIAPTLLNADQVIAPMQPVLAALAGSGITLSLEMTAPDVQVVIDATQLRQVVTNLVGNAAEATRGCGHMVRVRTSLVTLELDQARAQDLISEGTFLVLTVADDGKGMEPALVARVFDPFFTTKGKGKGKGEGTGLGLAMCASIVQRAGGFISVDTAPGEGASFQIHLPVAAQGPATHPGPVPEFAPGGAPPAPGPPPSGGWCVLLIEDHEPIRNLVARMLSARGVRVLEAPDLATARRFLAQPGIDLVLTDGRLPDGESVMLINEIRERHRARHVVVMSGSAPGSPGPAVDAVVPKPFRPDVLCETVMGLLARSGAAGRRDPLGVSPV
jgi:two-component system cell cycle sensor histidine kinase/response regulator CckA